MDDLKAKLPMIKSWIDNELAKHSSYAHPVSDYGFERLPLCFSRELLVSAKTSKYLNFIFVSDHNIVFDQSLTVLALCHSSEFAVVQSSIHESWARKHSSSHDGRPRYNASTALQNFPFPSLDEQHICDMLSEIGEKYHEQRRIVMSQLWLGLTDIYNLFHARDLTPAQVAKVSKKSAEEAEIGHQGILELRHLHHELDIAIRDAYGWTDLDLGHDFHEVETLPENDRVRYTISPAARKEVLKRLLAENHRRAAAQAFATPDHPKSKRPRKSTSDDGNGDLFA